MKCYDLLKVDPVKARLDVSTVCQLRCLLCPTDENNGRAFLKSGTMPPSRFTRFLDYNPQIKWVELASSGEAFLNPDLPEILKSAHERGVATNLGGGVNLNDASEEALEALVRYQTVRVRVSVDGVTEETYRRYRIGGSLGKVLTNIRKINHFKQKYRSPFPELLLQFILFGHNEHELEKVFVLGKMLDMNVFIKLNRCPDQLPVRDREKIRNLMGYADRGEFIEAVGIQYCRDLCLGLWKAPQINWDGRLLGCGSNTRMAFAEDVLDGTFLQEINNERMTYARRMLLGKAPPCDDIPCSGCAFYKQISEHKLWYTPEEIGAVASKHGVCYEP
ncbi:radical SAM protein [Desulfatiglans anilini]|uniref:radical SAM protein n=1 Tax=Desulfatiglans anilini TaxID=90728 RepID=UPI00040D3986|nr:radical SAM protein [Desulfatiglans anilini]